MNILKKLFTPAHKGLTPAQADELISLARSARQALEHGGRVSFASLKAVPFARETADAMVVNELISCYHLELHHDRQSLWDVEMKPGSHFGVHDHDAAEQLWVLEGECSVDGEAVVRFGTRRFEKGLEHNVTSEKGCRLVVLFTDPE